MTIATGSVPGASPVHPIARRPTRGLAGAGIALGLVGIAVEIAAFVVRSQVADWTDSIVLLAIFFLVGLMGGVSTIGGYFAVLALIASALSLTVRRVKTVPFGIAAGLVGVVALVGAIYLASDWGWWQLAFRELLQRLTPESSS